MADLKISQLTSATLPLAGTEVLPIVQSSTTKKVATDDLTVKNVRSNATTGILQIAGPAAAATRIMTVPDANFTAARTDAAQSFTGDQTLSTGNLVIGTSGKGIDFSATPGTGTSELFSDYEEGTWTATLKGSVSDPTTPVTATGRYTRVGRLVTISVSFDNINNTGAAGDVTVTGIPFNNSTPFTRVSGTVGYVGNFPIVNKYVACGMDENATAVYFNDIAGVGFGAALQHSPGGGRYLRFEMTYYAA